MCVYLVMNLFHHILYCSQHKKALRLVLWLCNHYHNAFQFYIVWCKQCSPFSSIFSKNEHAHTGEWEDSLHLMLGAVCDSWEQLGEGCRGWRVRVKGWCAKKCNDLWTSFITKDSIYYRPKASCLKTQAKTATYHRRLPRGFMLQSL